MSALTPEELGAKARRLAGVARPVGAAMNAPSPMSYAYDGQQCIGFVLSRGRRGHEAFDREQRSLGLFETAAKAANALFDSASNEESAG